MRSMKYIICKYLGSYRFENGHYVRAVTLRHILLYSMWILLSGIIISLIYDLILAYGGVEAVRAAIFYIA